MAEIGELFADALRSRWVAGLNKVSRPDAGGVETWLVSGNYSWLPMQSGYVQLDASSVTASFAEAMASEIARFSCATYESLLDAVPGDHSGRALGWALVRHYYATFYAAHSLLRISGKSVTMLSSNTAALLNSVGGQYLGISPRVSPGLHLVEIDTNNVGRVLISKIGSDKGGSHRKMWERFVQLVKDVEFQLINTQGQSQDALDAVDTLTELRKQLCRQGQKDGAWLSSVRNDLNYRQEHGVWFPYTVTEKNAIALVSRMQRWVPNSLNGYDIGLVRDDLSCFVDSCNVRTRLLTAALCDLSGRAAKTRSSFVDHKPFKLLRLRNVQI